MTPTRDAHRTALGTRLLPLATARPAVTPTVTPNMAHNTALVTTACPQHGNRDHITAQNTALVTTTRPTTRPGQGSLFAPRPGQGSRGSLGKPVGPYPHFQPPCLALPQGSTQSNQQSLKEKAQPPVMLAVQHGQRYIGAAARDAGRATWATSYRRSRPSLPQQ